MSVQSFVKKILKNDFSHFLENDTPVKSYVRFYFILSDNMVSFHRMRINQQYYLDACGKFKPFKQKNFLNLRDGFPFDKCFFAYSRQSMNEIRNAIIGAVDDAEKFCKLNNVPVYPRYFLNVELQKFKNPSHVFTIEELERVLKNGDDKKDNTLVVDENGHFALVQNDSMTYPVRFEMFCAGNRYVGKSVTQEEIDEYFGMALSGWLYFLEECEPVFVDYRMDSLSNEEKIKKIKKIIKNEKNS